jgi:hypothetical protein
MLVTSTKKARFCCHTMHVANILFHIKIIVSFITSFRDFLNTYGLNNQRISIQYGKPSRPISIQKRRTLSTIQSPGMNKSLTTDTRLIILRHKRLLEVSQNESCEFYYRVLHSLNHSLQKTVFNTRHSSGLVRHSSHNFVGWKIRVLLLK